MLETRSSGGAVVNFTEMVIGFKEETGRACVNMVGEA